MTTPRLLVIDPQPAFGAQEGEWPCSACGGVVLPLGRLGDRLHGRCRACGLETSLLTIPLNDPRVTITATHVTIEQDPCCEDCEPEAESSEAEPFANDWKPWS